MNYADIFLLVMIGVGFILGLVKGWWRVTIGAAVFGVAFYVLTMKDGVLDFVSNFVRYESLNFFIQKGWLQPIKVDLTSTVGVCFRVETIEELFLLLQNFDISPDAIRINCDIFCKMVGLSVIFPVLVFASMLASSIAYALILKWIMPKKLRKGIIPKILGGALNGVFYGAVGVCLLCLTYAPIDAIGNHVIPELTNVDSEIYKLIMTTVGNPAVIDKTVNLFNTYVVQINPIGEGSMICKPFIGVLNEVGLNPFNIISSDVTGQTISFAETFDNFVAGVVESIKKMSSSIGNKI